MDEQFEKTENSMSIYYTVNKMLIALHMALLVFFVVMRVYVMAAFCVAGVVVLYLFIPAVRQSDESSTITRLRIMKSGYVRQVQPVLWGRNTASIWH